MSLLPAEHFAIAALRGASSSAGGRGEGDLVHSVREQCPSSCAVALGKVWGCALETGTALGTGQPVLPALTETEPLALTSARPLTAAAGCSVPRGNVPSRPAAEVHLRSTGSALPFRRYDHVRLPAPGAAAAPAPLPPPSAALHAHRPPPEHAAAVTRSKVQEAGRREKKSLVLRDRSEWERRCAWPLVLRGSGRSPPVATHVPWGAGEARSGPP